MWLNLIFLVLLVLVFIPVALLLYSVSRWQAGIAKQQAQLEQGRGRIVPNTYDSAELDGLPAPVQRYFRTVLMDGQPMIAAAELRQEGELELGRGQVTWRPAVATQSIVTQRPGFVWDARVRLGPAVKVFVQDAYVAGRGLLKAALFGLFPLTRIPGSLELTHAELMRFLAEAALYPTKLLPSQGVQWSPEGDNAARAALADGDLSVALVFEFDEAGLISAVSSTGRYRAVEGAMIQTPWEARFTHYEDRSGMLIPLQGEVAWLLPAGRAPYWRGRITDILYKFSA